MRFVFLKIISELGRYTSILLFVAALSITIAWFSLLEDHLVYFLLLAPFAISLFTVSIALLIGLLFSGLKRPSGQFVTPSDAPKLWTIWNELSPAGRFESRLLRIDDRLNASIGERHRYFGLIGREVTMTVGLPLLAVLDIPTVRSVVAHEIGHAEHRHSVGLTNLLEFERSFETVFEFMPIGKTITGSFLYWRLGHAGAWLKNEQQRLSWQAEFEADAISAQKVGPATTARTLTIIAGAAGYFKSTISEPLDKALTGMVHVPPSPCQQFLARLTEARDPETIRKFAISSMSEPVEHDSTHPPYSKRIEAVGFASVPEVDALGPKSIDELLGAQFQAKLLTVFEQRWSESVKRYLNLD